MYNVQYCYNMMQHVIRDHSHRVLQEAGKRAIQGFCAADTAWPTTKLWLPTWPTNWLLTTVVLSAGSYLRLQKFWHGLLMHWEPRWRSWQLLSMAIWQQWPRKSSAG